MGVSLTALGILQQPLVAQNEVPLEPFFPADGKPVMRAEPVVKPVSETPVAPASEAPIPVAIPVAAPRVAAVPVATPMPVLPKATLAAPSRATPAPPKATPAAGPVDVTDPTNEIRLSPQGTMKPEQVQMSIADSFYTRKAYDQAAPEYEKYLTLYPAGGDRANVLYRLGESYRATGAVNAAKSSYEALLTQFSNSELLGPASYRLGDLYYQEKNYSTALHLYRRASVRLRDPKLITSAKFFTARCLEALGQKSEARTNYEELTNTANDNPFLEASRLSVALLFKEAGRTADALKQTQILAKTTANEELKAQAMVYSGLWARELDQSALAAETLKKALQLPGIARWRDVAELGMMQIYFADKKYQEIIANYTASGKTAGPETRPQLLTLVANTYRQLGNTQEAVTLLDQIIKEFPNSNFSRDAAGDRLTVLYAAGDANIITEMDQFLAANPDSPKRDQVLLMKAEWLFKKQDYVGSAPLYALVENSRTLSVPLKAEALSKLGWCLMQSKEYLRAIKAYSSLIDNYTTSKSIPAAFCQRGLARLRLKELGGALKDFEELISRFPKAKERELALHQKALIQGQMNENAGMAESFRRLLKDYPNTPVAPEANYWIGWVAFEAKDYKAAAELLAKARKLDKEQYFERAGLRVLLSYYYLEDKAAVGREIETYSKNGPKHPVPYEVLHWLGQGYYETGLIAPNSETQLEAFRNAVKYLGIVTERDDAKPDDFLNLGRSQIRLGDFKKAAEMLTKYLGLVREPIPRTTGLLALGQAQIGFKELDAAQKTAEAALGLQPDGELNARARVLVGDIQNARGNFEEAAKVYAMVVVIDDENVTPQALEKAVAAYKACGKEADAKRLLNTLQSRYPEYLQKKNAGP